MRIRILPYVLAAAGSFLLSLALVRNWESSRFSADIRSELFLKEFAFSEASSEKGSRKTFLKDGKSIAEYRFKNFNSDLIQIEFSKPSGELEEYWKGYGYSQSDLDNLKEWQKKAFNEAYQNALNRSPSKEDIDRIRAGIKDQYSQKLHIYFL